MPWRHIVSPVESDLIFWQHAERRLGGIAAGPYHGCAVIGWRGKYRGRERIEQQFGGVEGMPFMRASGGGRTVDGVRVILGCVYFVLRNPRMPDAASAVAELIEFDGRDGIYQVLGRE